MRPDARRWFDRRTPQEQSLPTDAALVRLKHGRTISVVVPALNEAATIAGVVGAVRRDLMDALPLVDELVVIDPGSVDDTAALAAAAGATVVAEASVLPLHGRVAGKGEALWKSLHATTGDLVVFIDGDLVDPPSRFVSALLAPLLMDPAIHLVKAAYDRPLAVDGRLEATGGGRVTELVARPLLDLHWPQLAGIVQPLGGEYAARRDLLERIPFMGGYGVELAMLVDTLDLVGLDAIAQVDLGVRIHRNHADADLGRMATALWQVATSRLERAGRLVLTDAPTPMLVQFRRGADGAYEPVTHAVTLTERPPMVTIAEYAARRAAAS